MAKPEAVPFLNGEIPVVGANNADGSGPTIQEFTKPANEPSTFETDVLVVGAGFSGITAIDRVRKAGLRVKCLESGEDFGGVWYWNRYPGARVDSELPFYQLNIPEVYKNWTFTERFPGHVEFRKYVAHIDQTLDLRKDTYFNARVNDASWDETSGKWTVKTLQGHLATAKYLLMCTGLLHRTFTPDLPGIKDYKGELYHSGAWNEKFSAKGKKVAIIGAGATAVQITQELGKTADELTCFVRRPSYCLPMMQRKLTAREQNELSTYYQSFFKAGRDSPTGFPNTPNPHGVFDVSEEERNQTWEKAWAQGGFQFQLSGFNDTVLSKEANKATYDFWRKKVMQRLTDSEKHKIMAPEKAPYYFGTKRVPLEQDYYEVLNQSNVKIYDLGQVPLKSFTDQGMLMAGETEHHLEFDAVIFATGFDSYDGSMARMGLKNRDGVDLKDSWNPDLHTYLGMMIRGFPNLFMSYSPQAPTVVSNGTTIIEAQVEIAVDMIKKLESEGVKYIEPRKEAEVEWKATLDTMIGYTLFPHTDSWWNRANIPGKKAQNLTYIGGINMYEKQCRATMNEWQGFTVVKALL